MKPFVTVENRTTDRLHRAQVTPENPHALLIDHPGPLTDFERGDLAQIGEEYATVLDRWPVRSGHMNYCRALALPHRTKVNISRAGEPVATNVRCTISAVGSTSKLQELLVESVASSTPFGRAAQLRKDLPGILALIDPADGDLREAIETAIERHDSATQVITRAGMDIQAGDEIVFDLGAGDQAVTVERLDRQTWPGAVVLTCSPPKAVPGFFRRLADRMKEAVV